MSTEELRVPPVEEDRSRRGRWWRGLTGSLAAGLAGLAVIVLGAGLLCLLLGAPGPGVAMLVGHPLAAAIALVAQRFADRREGPVAGLAGLVVVVVLLAALWLFWWG
ncbi:hypothetical protein LWP59_04750 [Amycolatopsis acidiphila]|uniref:Uncharacterized protein n=1 Tax=Amycolatopsis acidiphila TaxID=715473 RepID=A0A558A033_9PSEU|nr:hypothetical protein [Amycolatopsis acidiphila]TVT17625.1 hypothetical protein FNH06_30600 [Amycolatopsis acidiphila]UIJ60978.1 hypothetical protein LWP59_04750 [Amycolatopsis acidiphila]GHG88620.1 hypothetical protein GCM10017788_62980 [Amycolatopsis acidiphila]